MFDLARATFGVESSLLCAPGWLGGTPRGWRRCDGLEEEGHEPGFGSLAVAQLGTLLGRHDDERAVGETAVEAVQGTGFE